MKNLTYLLLIMLVVFSCYSIITNKIASTQLDNVMGGSVSPDWMASYQGILSISVGSKQLYPTSFARRTFAIQCWLGFAMIVIWGIVFTYIKYKERQAEYKIDYDSKTASDFTLLF